MFSEGHKICRAFSYVLIFIFTCVVLGISAAYINKSKKQLNTYYGASVELLVASIFTLLYLLLIFVFESKRFSRSGLFISSIIGELTVLSVLSGLYLGGVVAIRELFPHNTTHCHGILLCEYLESLKAFGWLTWALLVIQCINLIVAGHRQTLRSRRNLTNNIQATGNINTGRDIWGNNFSIDHENFGAVDNNLVKDTNGITTSQGGISDTGTDGGITKAERQV